VEIWRADELEVERGLSSELDEMWSFVQAKAHPRWLWHAIDHHTGKVLAYVFGRRKDAVFLKKVVCDHHKTQQKGYRKALSRTRSNHRKDESCNDR
jgi:hypothetical protein